jgi:hypothetical protein
MNGTRFVLPIACFLLAAQPALGGPAVELEGPLSPCTPVPGAAEGNSTVPGAPWGVVIATAFSKQEALDQFNQAKQTYADILGEYEPIVVEQCDLHMGTDLQYSMRIGMESREDADKLCAELQAKGGACVVQRN